MHNPAPVLENNTHELLWDFDKQTDLLISSRWPDLIIINNKIRKICKIVDFAVPTDHRIQLKEYEKRDKYLDLARELKKLWNMKVTIIPIVFGAFDTVTKGLLKSLEDLTGWQLSGGPSKKQHYWKRPEYWEESWRTRGDLLSLNLQWKTISLRWCYKL